MPKVTITFADTLNEDSNGNPVVDINTVSFPKFPESEKDYSPAQKTVIRFLGRCGQPDMQNYLCKMLAELILLDKMGEEILSELAECYSEATSISFNMRVLRSRLGFIRASIEQSIGTLN